MEGRDTSHQVEEWGDDSARPQKHAVKVRCKCCKKDSESCVCKANVRGWIQCVSTGMHVSADMHVHAVCTCMYVHLHVCIPMGVCVAPCDWDNVCSR